MRRPVQLVHVGAIVVEDCTDVDPPEEPRPHREAGWRERLRPAAVAALFASGRARASRVGKS